jgi:hypothetical protein
MRTINTTETAFQVHGRNLKRSSFGFLEREPCIQIRPPAFAVYIGVTLGRGGGIGLEGR